MEKRLFEVVLEKSVDGYFVYCPSLQGCYSQANTYEEALTNIRDAIRLHVEDRVAAGEALVETESISVTSLEVTV